jgi:hypothetical protein
MVLNDHGRLYVPGEIGELAHRGVLVTLGYLEGFRAMHSYLVPHEVAIERNLSRVAHGKIGRKQVVSQHVSSMSIMALC